MAGRNRSTAWPPVLRSAGARSTTVTSNPCAGQPVGQYRAGDAGTGDENLASRTSLAYLTIGKYTCVSLPIGKSVKLATWQAARRRPGSASRMWPANCSRRKACNAPACRTSPTSWGSPNRRCTTTSTRREDLVRSILQPLIDEGEQFGLHQEDRGDIDAREIAGGLLRLPLSATAPT